MSTSEQSSEKPAYPTWSATIGKLPAKWRIPFADSTARLVKIGAKGYLIDINGIDQEKLDQLMCTEGFRQALAKVIFPWAWKHPAGKPRKCHGICLNADLSTGMEPMRAIGATLEFVQPRRFTCPVSAIETSS